MRVGIDLDNTLINYEKAFTIAARQLNIIPQEWVGSKRRLKDYLLTKPEGERVWQTLQGQVYSSWIRNATLMEGAAWFLYRSINRGISICVVSHKTEYGHYDPKRVSLRKRALEWMGEMGFFIDSGFGLDPKDVYFENTRQEKVQRIGLLNLDYFIDDLPEIFQEPDFPASVHRILYGVNANSHVDPFSWSICNHWTKVSELILGKETKDEMRFMASLVLNNMDVKTCRSIDRGGNSRIYMIEKKDDLKIALKRYPFYDYEDQGRLEREFTSFSFLHQNGIDLVPIPVIRNDQLNVGTFEWIEGEKIEKPNEDDLQQALHLIRALYELRNTSEASGLPIATDACLSGSSLVRQINSRRKRLLVPATLHKQLQSHLENIFDPLWIKVQNWIKKNWSFNVDFNEILTSDLQTLSPSDFGFHNALRKDSTRLCFLDFEYFGWDDPVKLVSDFCWHPGMHLTNQLRTIWLQETFELFRGDPYFLSRLNILHPAFGLNWSLIVLNSYLSRARGKNQKYYDLEGQLEKSIKFCEKVNELIKNGSCISSNLDPAGN